VGLARLAQHRKDLPTARQLAGLGRRILAELDGPLDPSDRSEVAAVADLLSSPETLPVDESLTEKITRLTSPAAPTRSGSLLTGREQEVIELLAQGLSNLAIAEALHISRHTVTVHLRTIYDKLGVHSRTAATRWVLQTASVRGDGQV
jgi:DNA-binding NarL/FixJ family response regulator